MNWTDIQLLCLDVDGVLTDGTLALSWDDNQESLFKSFHVQDGAAIQRWQAQGGRVALLTGRDSASVTRRARELGITLVYQNASDKAAMFARLLHDAKLEARQVAYVGDDLPDMTVMRQCGFAAAVADAQPAVKRVSGYVTRRAGGRGAVAEVIELLLNRRGRPTECTTC